MFAQLTIFNIIAAGRNVLLMHVMVSASTNAIRECGMILTGALQARYDGSNDSPNDIVRVSTNGMERGCA